MTTSDTENPIRRIRPWIAALLTFLGWGVGLYYARRSGAAVWFALASVVVGVLVALAAVTYWLVTHTAPLSIFNPDGWSLLDTIQIAITTCVAIGVWVLTSKRQQVEWAGPGRLLGYFAIWLLPLLIALALAVAIRFTAMHPFRAPSLSMAPTIQQGDYFVVAKWSYGYSRYSAAPLQSLFPAGRVFARAPERGDVVVFRPTPEPDRDFVKRIVGLPGDRIQMIDGALYINGDPVPREAVTAMVVGDDATPVTAYRETLPNGVRYVTLDAGESELDNTRVFVVPEGQYFMLGDHRDSSADSRVPYLVGYVPFDNIVGRVVYIMQPEGTRRP